MEDFTYYDFSQVKNSRMLPPRTARLHHKKSAHVLILSADCSAELIDANKLHLRLCKNNLTDELFLVFSEDNGIVNTPKKTSKTTLYYNNKDLTKFLASHFLRGGIRHRYPVRHQAQRKPRQVRRVHNL